jgi:hypothetical protein
LRAYPAHRNPYGDNTFTADHGFDSCPLFRQRMLSLRRQNLIRERFE